MSTRPPATLYKYCSQKAVALLCDRRLKATSPNDFNDPFEIDPPIIGRASAVWLHKHFSQEDWLRKVHERSKQDISYEDHVKLHEQHGWKSAKTLHARQEYVRADVKKGLHVIRDRMKIICLSANPTDVLCWAHYTDKHRGFVVGIDSSRISPSNLEKVRYSKTRPSINLKTALVASKLEKTEYWRRVFRTKSPQWKYEREFRWIFRTEHATQETDTDGKEAYYLPFDPSLIKEVIFGSRCSNEGEIRNALRHPVFRNVNKFRATLDDRNFGIRIERTAD